MDLSDCARKADIKRATGVDISNLGANSDLASLNAKKDKVDVGKLNTVHVD